MPFNPDLSTIQEATFSNSDYFDSNNSSPTKSIHSEINQNLKRSILSGLNNLRRFQNNPIYDEESTLIEEDSEIFDETDHQNAISNFDNSPVQTFPDPSLAVDRNYDEIPLLVEPHAEVQKTAQDSTNFGHNRNNPDEIKINGKGKYDFSVADVTQNSKTSGKPIQKRTFLKRGQGKNCLNAKPNTVKNTAKKKSAIQKSASKSHPVQRLPTVQKPIPVRKHNGSNYEKENIMPKPSKNKLQMTKKQINKKTTHKLYDQEPEDSFNVSIQNEKEVNEHLKSKENKEETEFFILEKMLQQNSQLSLTQFENVMNDSAKSSNSGTSNNSVIENYHKIHLTSNETVASNVYFNPNKYEETDSLIEKNGMDSGSSPIMRRKTASSQNRDDKNLGRFENYTQIDSKFDDIEPLASSADDNSSLPTSSVPSSIQNSPTRVRAVRELDFSDSTPWDETLENDDTEGPSFSTPYRNQEETGAPSKLMTSIFKAQFDQSKQKEEKRVSQLEIERKELEKIKNEILKQKNELKREADRFKRENLALERVRQERERELEIIKLEKTKIEKENQKRTKELDTWEKEISQKLKEYRKLDHLHRESEKSGMIRRKDFDELKNTSALREKELRDKFDRLNAAHSRLKANNERLQSEVSDLKEDNYLLKEKMDAIARDSRRREGNTWREINRIVDKVTEPDVTTKRPTEVAKKAVKASAPNSSRRSISPNSSLAISLRSSAVFEPGHTMEIPAGIVESIPGDHCVTQRYASGKIVTKYDNGTVKEKSPDAKTEITRFANGDVQQQLPDGKVVYFYKNNGATSSKLADGTEILEFKNGQKEIQHLDGRKEIVFPDKLREITWKNNKRETFYPNGDQKIIQPNGDEVILFTNGDKEERTKEYRRRVLPDGTTKTIFNDTNLTETRYSSGRIRIKDASGNIIVDRKSEHS